MPSQELIYRIFVASPSDVTPERECLDGVISEVNQLNGKSKGIRFELIRWETHTYPDIGTDSQEVINKQIGKDYDIFLGIMWSRAGTATLRSQSGTIEEFENAYKIHCSNPDKINIMFYFKDTPIKLTEIDPNQLNLIKNFRTKLKENGVLFRSFESIEEFKKLVRMNLSLLIDDLTREDSSEETNLENISTPENEVKNLNDCDLDLGLFDYLEIMETNGQTMNEAIEEIGVSTKWIGQKFRETTEEINRNAEIGVSDITRNKLIVNNIAEKIEENNKKVNSKLPILKGSFRNYMHGIKGYTRLLEDFDGTENNSLEAINNLNSLKIQMEKASTSINEFNDGVQNLPRATSKLNKAKKNSFNIYETIENELNVGINILNDVLDYLRGRSN